MLSNLSGAGWSWLSTEVFTGTVREWDQAWQSALVHNPEKSFWFPFGGPLASLYAEAADLNRLLDLVTGPAT
jgi:hypothetical protein